MFLQLPDLAHALSTRQLRKDEKILFGKNRGLKISELPTEYLNSLIKSYRLDKDIVYSKVELCKKLSDHDSEGKQELLEDSRQFSIEPSLYDHQKKAVKQNQ